MARSKKLHPRIREALQAPDEMTDRELLRNLRERTKIVCKPCWELKYCPYGPLVEDFPLLPSTRKTAEEHHVYLERCLESGRIGTDQDKPLDVARRQKFEVWIAEFDPDEHPEDIPPILDEAACRVFGHLCPVIFVSEPFTETSEARRMTRYIPAAVKMRVARRDNYMCQEPGCDRQLKDYEIEFDHIIPVSRGGSSEEHNIRVTCLEHNRRKGNRVDL
jgi:hypothetical protein